MKCLINQNKTKTEKIEAGSSEREWLPSKRSSKKTLAEAIAKRERRMRERTLSAIARDRKRIRELLATGSELQVGSI